MAVMHMALHLLVPFLLAWVVFRRTWLKSFALLMFGLIIDVDHLLAEPIYDPNRCSIGFHPLHTAPAVVAYVILACVRATRLVGIGLVVHIVLDLLDCARIAS
jgi:hypothetical protein